MSLVIKIDGVDKADNVKRNSITITDQINERADTCDFIVSKYIGQSFVPSLDDEVIVELDGDRIFAGIIIGLSDRMTGPKSLDYKIKCADYTHHLDRLLITERYEDKTIDFIINDLLTNYASDFTDVGVIAPITIDSVAFNRIPISQCIKKLATLVNYNWSTDYFKDIKFFARSADPSPFNISDTSNNYIYDSLSLKHDISQLRNKILVEGAEVESSPRTVKYAGTVDSAEFDTQYKFSSKPTVTVDGVTQTVGIENIDDELSFDCMWSFQQKYIRFTAGNEPGTPAGDTNVDITGIPLFPILVNVPAPSSIGVYGTYEYAVKDTSITSQGQAIDRATAEIQAYGAQINEGGFKTYTPGLKSGQIININSTIRGINEDLVIQRVQFRMLSNDSDFPGVWTITVATLKMIGIIEILQKLLLDEELTINEQETLLTFLQFMDSAAITDSIGTPSTTTGPYLYGTAIVGFSTW